MARRKTPNEVKAPQAVKVTDNAYIAWGNKIAKDLPLAEKKAYIDSIVSSVDNFQVINRDKTLGYENARPGYRQDMSNLAPGISGRPGFTRDDYDWFRPSEASPKSYHGIICMSDDIYREVGLIRNIIDLMGDFACQGIRLIHPNKRIQRFYRRWWKKIHGSERAERFTNNICRLANVIIRRETGKISLKTAEEMFKIEASDAPLQDDKVEKRDIPIKYTYLHPATVEQIGGPVAAFSDTKLYGVRLPGEIRKVILNPTTEYEKQVVAGLPTDIINAAKTASLVLLPPDKTFVYHYKKDDWQAWGLPMIYAILDDVAHLKKLRLADSAALDGIISHIRIFNIGDLEHDIPPTVAAINKLSEILQANTGGGTIDIVWGPDLKMTESAQANYQALNEDKYRPTLNAIYQALGIPPTLTGTYGESGTTNNYISLQTLVERLKYIRGVLCDFWEQEIEYVRKAMGFRLPAKIEFDFMNLGNKEALLALYVQMADRNIISDETMQYALGQDPDLEKVRLLREQRERAGGRMVPKANSFYDPEFENALKKIALTTGVATPSEVGLELEERKPGEKSALDITSQSVPNNSKKSATPQGGRPKNSKDSKKRKEKKFTPKKKAGLELWAAKAQQQISDILNPILLESLGKSSFRAVSDADLIMSENVKFGVLSNVQPYSEITEENILPLIGKATVLDFAKWAAEIKTDLNRDLTVEELRKLQVSMYSYHYGRL